MKGKRKFRLRKHESFTILATFVYYVEVQFDKQLSNRQHYFLFFIASSCTYIGKSQVTFYMFKTIWFPFKLSTFIYVCEVRKKILYPAEESKTIQQMYVLTYVQKFLNKIIWSSCKIRRNCVRYWIMVVAIV